VQGTLEAHMLHSQQNLFGLAILSPIPRHSDTVNHIELVTSGAQPGCRKGLCNQDCLQPTTPIVRVGFGLHQLE